MKLAYFVLGIAVPVAGYVLWSKSGCCSKKEHIDEVRDKAVEDSFPASDPPASW